MRGGEQEVYATSASDLVGATRRGDLFLSGGQSTPWNQGVIRHGAEFLNADSGEIELATPGIRGFIVGVSVTGDFAVLRAHEPIDDTQVASFAQVVDPRSGRTFDFLGDCMFSYDRAVAVSTMRVLASGCHDPAVLVDMHDGTTTDTEIPAHLLGESLAVDDGAIFVSGACPESNGGLGLCHADANGTLTPLVEGGIPRPLSSSSSENQILLSAAASYHIVGPLEEGAIIVDKTTHETSSVLAGKRLTALEASGDRLCYVGTQGALPQGVLDLASGTDLELATSDPLVALVPSGN